MTERPEIHPNRKAPKFRPLKALHHMRNLIADKEDTEQVFHIIEALSGKAAIRDFKRFRASPEGKARIAENLYLPDFLDDHERHKALPEGTVGRAYVDFMQREGLTAKGLVEESQKYMGAEHEFEDEYDIYIKRRRDTHDMLHILTGYGRDALGEASVLGFTHAQHGSPGAKFIGYMAAREIRKYAPNDAATIASVREGERLGKAAQMVAMQHIPSLLAENLDEARKRLGIGTPQLYHDSIAKFSLEGSEPLKPTAQADKQAA